MSPPEAAKQRALEKQCRDNIAIYDLLEKRYHRISVILHLQQLDTGRPNACELLAYSRKLLASINAGRVERL